jgi:hypothetical protein
MIRPNSYPHDRGIRDFLFFLVFAASALILSYLVLAQR